MFFSVWQTTHPSPSDKEANKLSFAEWFALHFLRLATKCSFGEGSASFERKAVSGTFHNAKVRGILEGGLGAMRS